MTKCDPVWATVACDTRNINESETRGPEPDTLINVILPLSLKESARTDLEELNPPRRREGNGQGRSNRPCGIVGCGVQQNFPA